MQRISIFLTVAALIAGMVGYGGCGGDYTPPSQNFEIYDWYDLDAIRDNSGRNYTLMNDLDSTTSGYEELASPIANDGKGWKSIEGFYGTFDGQGYEIYDLSISCPGESDVGLFGVVETGGVIENVGMVNGNITSYKAVGSLAGYNRGTVRNSYARGNVTGDLGAGSLVGVNDGTVTHSYSSGSVIGRDGVGGLMGKNEGTISNSYSVSAVNGNNFVGDLVGVNGGTVSNSYSSGTVSGSDLVGGLVGKNEGVVSKCYSTGNVTGGEHIGGLVGQNLYGVVSNSFWDTETSGQASSAGGTGKTTAEMQEITTFSGATWDIVAVVNPSIRNPSYIWNIVDDETYPFLSWESVS